MDRSGSYAENTLAPSSKLSSGSYAGRTRCVRGTIDIPEDLALHNRDLVDRVLDVLVRQWGLSAVEVRILADDEAPGETDPNSRRRLEVAGHSLPLALADC
jgi:hypothetical protein